MKALEVKYLNDFRIYIKFSDGSAGAVDLSPLVEKGIFKVLKDKDHFSKVYTTGYSIAWSSELEIDALAIYMEITGKKPEEFKDQKHSYATD